MLHMLSRPPSALPCVSRRDMEAAWEAAQAGGAPAPPLRKFCFAVPQGAPVELVVADRDAAAWAAAVERWAGLSTPHGVSVCLRLLALVALMAQAGWVREWFGLGRLGAEIRPELLLAAAQVPLDEDGGFDETALRALLPRHPARGLKT